MIAVEGVKLLTRRTFKAWNQLQTNNFRVLLTARTLDWVTYVTGMPTSQRPAKHVVALGNQIPARQQQGAHYAQRRNQNEFRTFQNLWQRRGVPEAHVA